MKKTIKKVVVAVMTLAMVVSMVPTVQTDAATKKQVKSVKVTNVKKKKLTLMVGQSKKLKVKVKVKGKASKKVTFKSSNKKVATVTKKGVVKAKKVGKAKITVRSKANKKKKVVIKLTVKKATAVNKPQKPQETKPAVEETTKPVEETTKPVEETTKPVEETTPPVEETTTPPVEETTTPPVEETTKPGKIETSIDTSSDDFYYDEDTEEAYVTCKVTFEKAGIYSITMNDELLGYNAEAVEMYSDDYEVEAYLTNSSVFVTEPGEYNVDICLSVSSSDLEELEGMLILITFEETEANFEEISTEIELNTPIEYECTEENDYSYFKFTAPEDGVYYLYTKSTDAGLGADTIGILIDKKNNISTSDDTYGMNCGFTVELKAGETVYFGVMGIDEEEAGNIVEVWVSDVEPEVSEEDYE